MDLVHSPSFDLAVQFAGLLTPFILFLLGGLHMSNLRQFSELKVQLRHQDTCLDSLRSEINSSVLAQSVESRKTINRADFETELTRARQAISTEMSALRTQQDRNIDTIAELRIAVAEIKALQRSNIRRISDILDDKQ